jgi:hypothetical protein
MEQRCLTAKDKKGKAERKCGDKYCAGPKRGNRVVPVTYGERRMARFFQIGWS